MRNNRQLIAERYNTKKAFKKWRRVLDICHEGVTSYNDKEVLYHNNGMDREEESSVGKEGLMRGRIRRWT